MSSQIMKLSVVIIVSRRYAGGAEQTLKSLAGLEAEIVLFDTTNSDCLKTALQNYEFRVCKGTWDNYEHVRYKAAACATCDWILMMHTGEEIDDRLKKCLQSFAYGEKPVAFRVRLKSLFENKRLDHGEWSGFWRVRLANRKGIAIHDERVSEQVFLNDQFLWVSCKDVFYKKK